MMYSCMRRSWVPLLAILGFGLLGFVSQSEASDRIYSKSPGIEVSVDTDASHPNRTWWIPVNGTQNLSATPHDSDKYTDDEGLTWHYYADSTVTITNWTTTAGSVSPTTGSSTTFTAPNYAVSASIEATANDNPETGADDTPATCTATVNVVDVAIGGPQHNVMYAGDTGTVSCSFLPSTPPGAITYTWSMDTGPGTLTFGSLNGQSTTVTTTQPGRYTVKVTVTWPDGTLAKTSGNIYFVGVKNIKIQAGENWDAIDGDPREVFLKGTRYTFKAFRDPEDAPSWPTGTPIWCGLSAVQGNDTVQISLNTVGDVQQIFAWCGNFKDAYVDVIVPSIKELEFVGCSGGSMFDINDSTEKWSSDTNAVNPCCYKQGGKTAVKAKFFNSKSLTYATEVVVSASSSCADATGGGYGAKTVTFQNWDWISEAFASDTNAAAKIMKEDVDIGWSYKVTWGTNTSVGAGSADGLRYYVIWDSPKNGSPQSSSGFDAEAWADTHFTKAHLSDACEFGEGGNSETNIADNVCSALARNSLGDAVANTVQAVWGIHNTGAYGLCDDRALEMCYVMRCLGLEYKLAFANLWAAINDRGDTTKPENTNGQGYCQTCRVGVALMGDSFWSSNNFQGCAYRVEGSPIRDTLCWDVQHGYNHKKYWELGNDDSNDQYAPEERHGLLYTYHWRSSGGGGGTAGQIWPGTVNHSGCNVSVSWQKTGN